MATPTLFEHDDYKDLLRTTLVERKETVGKAYTFQAMAKACRVQKTYLSRVFNGDAHLSDDQVFLAGEFLGLTATERSFLAMLHQRARTVVPQKRRILDREIGAVRKRQATSEAHLAAPRASVDEAVDLAAYYLDPDLQVLHLYLTVDRYARDPVRLQQMLGLGAEDFARGIARLRQLGLIATRESREGEGVSEVRYEVLRPAVHLPSDSPVFRPHRKLLRLRALDRVDRARPGEAYTFSVLFSADEATRVKIQARFLEFLSEIEKEVQAAPAEDVHYMSFDLFRWVP